MLENTFTLHTNGKGYWSDKATAVTVEALDLQYISNERDFGELCIHFNTATWDTAVDGLIYTDKLFMQELRAYLQTLGFTQKKLTTLATASRGCKATIMLAVTWAWTL